MKTWVYREDGGKFLVNILSDVWEGDMRHVKLECIRTVRPSPLCGDIENGERFSVSAKKGWEPYVGWTLELEETEEAAAC